MTVVVAKKVGEKIFTFSDTMLTNRNATKDDGIPGVLKTIVIALNLTVSISGNYTKGLDVVRKAKTMFAKRPDIDSVLDFLRGESEDKETDFIVAAHRMIESKTQAELFKIWEGYITAPLDSCWIGDPQVADFIISLKPPPLNLTQSHSISEADPYSSALKQAVNQHFLQKGTVLGDGVGGFPIFGHASPFGHTYDNYAGKTRTVPQIIGGPMPDSSAYYGFSMNATGLRGIALMGVWVGEAKIGYIYTPATRDHPFTVEAPTMPDMNRELDKLAIELGGVNTSHWTWPGEGFPHL